MGQTKLSTLAWWSLLKNRLPTLDFQNLYLETLSSCCLDPQHNSIDCSDESTTLVRILSEASVAHLSQLEEISDEQAIACNSLNPRPIAEIHEKQSSQLHYSPAKQFFKTVQLQPSNPVENNRIQELESPSASFNTNNDDKIDIFPIVHPALSKVVAIDEQQNYDSLLRCNIADNGSSLSAGPELALSSLFDSRTLWQPVDRYVTTQIHPAHATGSSASLYVSHNEHKSTPTHFFPKVCSLAEKNNSLMGNCTPSPERDFDISRTQELLEKLINLLQVDECCNSLHMALTKRPY